MELPQLQIARYVEQFVDYLMLYHAQAFEAIKAPILAILFNIENGLTILPWWILCLSAFVLGWWLAGLRNGITYSILLFVIYWIGLWKEICQGVNMLRTIFRRYAVTNCFEAADIAVLVCSNPQYVYIPPWLFIVRSFEQ